MNSLYFQEKLIDLSKKKLERTLKVVRNSQNRNIVIGQKEVLNFCSNNYLGLADDERLKKAAGECLEKEGFGAGASRLVCGTMAMHDKLERRIADFKDTERALVFSTGYMANIGIISGLFGRGDAVFSDKLNHASIVDGILLSRADFYRYRHKDMIHLQELLEKSKGIKRKLIVTDSVFSMDGDLAPLKEIVELAQRYQAFVMVDEAHAFGVFGKKGKGLVEHLELEGQIEIQMGTLSKAVGSLGAYCCGSKVLIEYLINHARSFIYTTALPPLVCAASIEAINIIGEEPGRRQQLWENTRYLKTALHKMGLDTMESQSPIIPVLLKDNAIALEFSKQLFEEGVFVQAIRPPTVPKGMARLRVTVMATHTKDDLDFAIKKFKKIKGQICPT